MSREMGWGVETGVSDAVDFDVLQSPLSLYCLAFIYYTFSPFKDLTAQGCKGEDELPKLMGDLRGLRVGSDVVVESEH